MKDILASALVLVGSSFVLLAAVGILRFPDLYMRMQAATKASTLGAGALMAAVAVNFARLDITTRCGLVLVFLFLAAPVAAYAIARAAYAARVPLWRNTFVDELHPVLTEASRDEMTGGS